MRGLKEPLTPIKNATLSKCGIVVASSSTIKGGHHSKKVENHSSTVIINVFSVRKNYFITRAFKKILILI